MIIETKHSANLQKEIDLLHSRNTNDKGTITRDLSEARMQVSELQKIVTTEQNARAALHKEFAEFK